MLPDKNQPKNQTNNEEYDDKSINNIKYDIMYLLSIKNKE